MSSFSSCLTFDSPLFSSILSSLCSYFSHLLFISQTLGPQGQLGLPVLPFFTSCSLACPHLSFPFFFNLSPLGHFLLYFLFLCQAPLLISSSFSIIMHSSKVIMLSWLSGYSLRILSLRLQSFSLPVLLNFFTYPLSSTHNPNLFLHAFCGPPSCPPPPHTLHTHTYTQYSSCTHTSLCCVD